MKSIAPSLRLLLAVALLLPAVAGLPAASEAAATCTLPYSETIRGKLVEWDQCYVREFDHDGTDYVIRAYYTEIFNPDPADANYSQCDPMVEDPNVICEHALPDNDDGNGDNSHVVTLAEEAENALRFYIDQNLSPIPATDFYIYIAEDPKNGWIVEPDGIITDDEKADDTDELSLRWNVYHEMQHLIQRQYYDGHWNLWWTEGLARTIEDRVDPALDAGLYAFIVDSRRMLTNSADHDFPRDNDIFEAKYRAVVWWTWVLDQYRDPGETASVLGWLALTDFYNEIATGVDSLSAADNFLAAQGSSFHDDFIDYTLAMYAYKYNPSDPRLGFLDTEFIAEVDLDNHTVIGSPPAGWTVDTVDMAPRSSR